MQLKDFDISTRYAARVVQNERITAPESGQEVREIVVEVDNPDFDVEVGQNFGVLAPGNPALGQEHHLRLYSIADVPRTNGDGTTEFTMCVRRCDYIDDFSGERYKGVASNFLCDLTPNQTFTITGPYGHAFDAPRENNATLVLIGMGTGIAPFRAFVKYLHASRPEYVGRVILFHGGRTGLDLLYRNDKKDDFALYYDSETFEAINVLSSRPALSDSIDWGSAILPRGEEIRRLLDQDDTYVYLAGLTPIRNDLDTVMGEVFGSAEAWQDQKSQLESDDRWVELLY
ncbi:ferredoxin reductase domain-containing protein [Crateriforma conspicua]|uniref:Ferredoxin--NADP reductase n=1 Tax=Crateriforma conspicua TaxID=2527996 RepID=A0A5C5Y054_9PLAN|nr:ferredoxin-NADP reductase [Crateriforma conspicua]TWT69106.1 Ferredoxin--NADP reductase [Crateriforma conspicua]